MIKENIISTAHSTIDADSLGQLIIKLYGFKKNLVCELLHRGMNDFYLLRTEEKLFVAQVWRPNTKKMYDLNRQMEFLTYLHSGGIRVPIPQKNISNEWIFSFQGMEGNRFACVFNFVSGEVFSKNPTESVSKSMGMIFGKLHNLSESFTINAKDKQIKREINILSSMPYLENLVGHRNDDLIFYKELASELNSIYQLSYKNDNLRIGMTHGDFHIHNAFILGKKEITIMDFDACGVDFFAQEIMSYRWSIEKNSLSDKIWDSFLSGYDSVRTLNKDEIKSFDVFLLGKELSYLCGFAKAINAIGHVSFHFPGLDWFSRSLRNHSKLAKLI
ncbi:MAG: Homoserine kinase [Alphaproteobacteria bacterium MarineAlpha2_Bin1]|nr:MAG: Homoserine kinase [Alphaproteobacteria bacterium MarineAlpha2_Bin1]